MTATLDTQETTAGEIPSFEVTLKVRRFNPEQSDEAFWEEHTLTMYGTDRVLDALHKIKWDHDGSLTFRRSCAHGICGSDAMRINGRNRLACKVLLKDLNPEKGPITVEPIKGLPVIKDLVVDMEPFSRPTVKSCRSLSQLVTNHPKNACKALNSENATMTPRSASSALRAHPPALCFGLTANTLGQLRSSTLTGLSLTRVTKAPLNASKSSTTKKGCGGAAQSSTALKHALEVSK